MLFRRKKKEEPVITYPYGYMLAQQPTTLCTNRVLSCFVKGLFIFAACAGTIGGVISSFGLPCHLFTILLALFILSEMMAFLHYSRMVFNVFYPVVFISFVYFIITCRYMVNSGFQAFVTILQETYSDYFDLSIYREVTEYVTNRTVTITYAAIFIGFFLILLLNIAISEYMSLLSVILLTFPIFQLGIYVEQMPDFIYLILLLFSYFMVAILKQGGHFLLPYASKKWTEFAAKDKNGELAFKYHASGKIMLQLTGLFLLFSVLLGILCAPLLTFSADTAKNTSLRKLADEEMAIFVQSGLGGFFNRYQATGGINKGQLGGISSVRPDYEPDLDITFVPFSTETLYIKSYVGSVYTGSAWEELSDDLTPLQLHFGDKYEDYNRYISSMEADAYETYAYANPGKGLSASMQIKNLDANTECIYQPYFAKSIDGADYRIDRGNFIGQLPIHQQLQIHYYPYTRGNITQVMYDSAVNEREIDSPQKQDFLSTNTDYVTAHYLDIPLDLQDFLQSVHEEIGTSSSKEKQILLIQKYFLDNFTYTMAPGATPYRQDYVRYFLETQKRGYCAHFASAATLLLRSYGIPARYVEGYAVSFSEVAEGEALSDNVEDWQTGYNPLKDTGVIKVSATDADAHAWVEVYFPEVGWVPYEFTLANAEEDNAENAYADFLGLFSDLFRPIALDNNENDTTNNDLELPENVKKNKALFQASLFTPLFLFIAITVILFLVYHLVKQIRYELLLQSNYQKGNYIPLLSREYQKLCKLLRNKHLLTEAQLLPTDFPTFHETLLVRFEGNTKNIPGEEEIVFQMAILEKCFYARESCNKKEADELLLFLKRYMKFVKKIK